MEFNVKRCRVGMKRCRSDVFGDEFGAWGGFEDDFFVFGDFAFFFGTSAARQKIRIRQKRNNRSQNHPKHQIRHQKHGFDTVSQPFLLYIIKLNSILQRQKKCLNLCVRKKCSHAKFDF